jgi:hypothetical protein
VSPADVESRLASDIDFELTGGSLAEVFTVGGDAGSEPR